MLIIIIACLVVCCQGFFTSNKKSVCLYGFGNKLSHQNTWSISSLRMADGGPFGWLKNTLNIAFPSQNLILSELKNMSKKQDAMSDDLKVVKANQDDMFHRIVGLDQRVTYLTQDRGPTIELAVRNQLGLTKSPMYARNIHVKKLKSSLSFFCEKDYQLLPNEPISNDEETLSDFRELLVSDNFLVIF